MFKYALFDYIPQRRLRKSSFETRELDRMILAFKDGRKFATSWAAREIYKALKYANLNNFILVCCPASCQRTQVRRYRRFSKELCELLGISNGFDYIKVIMKREKKHISKNTDIDQSSNIEIDRKFFRGKKVLVFDDICTSGKTSQTFIEQMEMAGAKVKMAMFLAKTKQVCNY